MGKLSVVISAYNEEKNIKDCIDSLRDLADEIIVVDNSSTDKTAEIAKKLGANIFTQENDPSRIDLQKNFGFSKATCDWILSLDADERITPELTSEIKSNIQHPPSNIQGYEIPRKNIIFGKWIEHTGWYPDYQLRLFKKGKGKYVSKKVHEPIVVEGKIERLLSPIHHENYQSINQFLNRMVAYTDSEAEALLAGGYEFNYIDAIRMPFQEFLRRFFTHEGYKDGLHGLILSLLMGFYHFFIFLKVWEKNKFTKQDKILYDFNNEAKNMNKIFVIILNFNGAHNTLECLKSLEKLDIPKNVAIEPLVVDNSSTDDSVREIKKEFPKITLVGNQTNIGFTGGNNEGIRYSLKNGADFTILLNKDTIVHPDLIKNLLNSFTRDTRDTLDTLLIGGAVPKIYFEKGYEFHKDSYKESERGKVIWYAGG